MNNKKLKLNVQLVKKLQRKYGLTLEDMASMGGRRSRQAVYDLIKYERPSGAVFFAKVFRCKPKDLIK